MAQDLITISLAAFELQLPMMSIGTLKSLMVKLAEYKRSNGAKLAINSNVLILLLRKEAKIQKELSRRGYVRSAQDKRQFSDWQRKLDTGLKRWQ